MNRRVLLGLSVLLATGLLGYLYADSLIFLFNRIGSDDYSHGIFVPAVCLFLVWQARHRISAVGIKNSWLGPAIVSAGLLLYGVGELATLYVVQHLSLWIVLVGLVIGAMGVRAAREIMFPLAYLLTAIPLPNFLYAGLSSKLQLWSSALGIGCLQLIGVTAFREGNVIDLGPVQLQVVEACSGIRYLLPLASLALLCAYLFKDRMWKRIVLVLSSIPISIFVNGFRIGMIGLLVEWDGQGAAEGFSHLFEGAVLFMASLGLLILEMWLLAKVHPMGSRMSFSERFTWTDDGQRALLEGRGLRPEAPTSNLQPSASNRVLPGPAFLFSVALLVPVAFAATFLTDRKEIAPTRAIFVDFPMQFDGWVGTALALEKQYVDALRFDDYVLADFRSHKGQSVTFYVAYYQSQRKGQSAHSPQSCLPGDGWEIASMNGVDIPAGSGMVRSSVYVNRAVIQKGNHKQVVWYWFKQRDRILSNEYLVKFFLFWDAITRGRTDGALVRVSSVVGPGETEEIVDQRLLQLVSVVEPELNRYVPD
ncbi:MAG: Eight transmembrane protein EpsH / EpsI protein [Nitrospira sp.]|nr:MAG: Eight transmembrane protein EpsH / EpsI protein [Nitrospira sp.]